MNRKLLYVIVAIVAIVLLLPLYSYSPSDKSSITITVKARLDEGSYQPDYSISFDKGSASYFDHMVNWWQGLANPVRNPAEGPEIYPLVSVQIERNWGQGFDSQGRPIPPPIISGIYPYEFNESWECTYEISDVPANGQVKVTVVLYWSPEMSDGGYVQTYVA